jgi:pyruvate dehydrogenase E2 component (dihydrolipoamide acetyltransferase)
METVFRLPDLGEGLREAEIVAWQVGVGDHVVADQPLVSVETDKAVVEIPSPHSGRIAALHGSPGDVVAVGAPLVEFEVGVSRDQGAIVGEVAGPAGDGQDATNAGAAVASGSVSPVAGAGVAPAVRAAPAVRRRAAELGLNLTGIAGTGPGGAVTMADLQHASAEASAGAHVQDQAGGPVAEKLRGVRRAMSVQMARAGREVVRATVTGEADIHAWPAGADPTVRLIRAIVGACRASPSLNAWFDAKAQTRILHRQVDLGIALETDDGLFTPVIRDAGRLGDDALRERLDVLKRDVAARTVARDALVGQTITLSNFGTHGGLFAELVVVPPQVAILGAGRALERMVVVDGAPAVRRMMPLSLSFDHRAVTGVEATRFLNAAIDELKRA